MKAKDGSKASTESGQQLPTRTLQNHELSSYIEINCNLQTYCDVFMGPQHLDYLVHLDTDDLTNVYRWRMQQEHALRRNQNKRMSDEQVIPFVECYMPAYELYLDYLRQGFFNGLSPDERAQKGYSRVVLGREREIIEMVIWWLVLIQAHCII